MCFYSNYNVNYQFFVKHIFPLYLSFSEVADSSGLFNRTMSTQHPKKYSNSLFKWDIVNKLKGILSIYISTSLPSFCSPRATEPNNPSFRCYISRHFAL